MICITLHVWIIRIFLIRIIAIKFHIHQLIWNLISHPIPFNQFLIQFSSFVQCNSSLFFIIFYTLNSHFFLFSFSFIDYFTRFTLHIPFFTITSLSLKSSSAADETHTVYLLPLSLVTTFQLTDFTCSFFHVNYKRILYPSKIFSMLKLQTLLLFSTML